MSEQAATQDHSAAALMASTEPHPIQDGAAPPVRILVLAAVCLGVAALAAAAFVLSYSGIHAVAIQAGQSSQHARDYPVLIDAMLVITLLAVLGLRGAGLPSRILSWFALLCVLAAGAGADVLHATGRMLRHTVGAVTAAALPWALVFIAFVLLLALLRHARLRRQASLDRRRSNPQAKDADSTTVDRPIAASAPPSLPVRTPQAWDSASIVPGFSARLASSAAAGAAAAAAEQPGPPDAETRSPADADHGEDQASLGLAGADDSDTSEGAGPAAAEPADSGPSPAEARTEVADHQAEPAEPAPADAGAAPKDHPPAEPADPGAAESDPDAAAEPYDPPAAESDDPPAADPDVAAMLADTGSVDTFSAADESDDPATNDPAPVNEGADDDVADNMPVFHRMWSTPTPPDS
jgi:hypothetical protein